MLVEEPAPQLGDADRLEGEQGRRGRGELGVDLGGDASGVLLVVGDATADLALATWLKT